MKPASKPKNKNKVLILFSFVVVVAVFFNSCIYPKYALNSQEQAYVNKHSDKIAQTFIYYDAVAVRKLKSNGVYTVEINQGAYFPFSDTPLLKSKALGIVSRILPIMNFKEHHKYIDVVFVSKFSILSSNYVYTGRSSENTCTIRVPVITPTKARVFSIYETRDTLLNNRLNMGITPLPEPAPVPVSRFGL